MIKYYEETGPSYVDPKGKASIKSSLEELWKEVDSLRELEEMSYIILHLLTEGGAKLIEQEKRPPEEIPSSVIGKIQMASSRIREIHDNIRSNLASVTSIIE